MRSKFQNSRTQLAVLTLLALPCCAWAQAQTPDAKPPATDAKPSTDADQTAQKPKDVSTLQTVTITAERRTEPLQTSSISATVLSGDDLLKAGVSVVDQLQYATPSTAANNFGQGLNITIRGIGKAETNTQTTTGVITYRDGVATFPGYFTEEPYYDIKSVEILRGPQGTFGGQNATGGAVLVESNDPVIQGGYHGYVAGQLGNYSDVGVQGAVNVPISDTLAARIAFNSENRDSFWTITGPYTGGNGQLREQSARVSLLWRPETALTVLLKTDYNHINMGAYPADPVNSPNDPFTITANANLKALDQFSRTVLKVEYAFDNGMKFRSVSGYQHGTSAYQADLDGSSANNWSFKDLVPETIYSQEFNLISPDSGPVTWLLGAYAQNDTHLFPPGQFVTGVPAGSPYTEYDLEGTNPTHTRAIFGQVSYLLADDLKLVVEGRDSSNKTTNTGEVNQYGTPLDIYETAQFKNFSGKVALNWTVSDKQFLYAFVASAARPGGLNVPVGFGAPAPFKSEQVKTAEVGWKGTWLGGHVQTQTSVFYNDYQNFQVTIGYPTYPTFGFELNTPNPTHIYGFEEQVQAQLGDGWAARANLGWLHSAIGNFYATDPRIATTTACDPIVGPASASCISLGGHEQTYAPTLTFNVGLERRFVIGDTTVTPRVNYAHVSSQWATLFENRALGDQLGSRNLVSAQIDWEHGDFTGSLYSTNLTDERYLSAIGSGLRYAGAPRQYGVRLTKFF